MIHRQRVNADDVTAHRIEGDLVVSHGDQAELEWQRGEHATLASDDRVDRDELRLRDVLQVCDFAVEFVVVVKQPVTIVLDADVVLHAERDRRPRVRFELGYVDEEVSGRYRGGRVQAVADAALMVERNCHLRFFFEVVDLRAGAFRDGIVACFLERIARGNRDAASLTDGQFGNAVGPILECEQDSFGEFGSGEGVWEDLARRDDIRLDERAPHGAQSEAIQAVPDNASDALGVVLSARTKNHGRFRHGHVILASPAAAFRSLVIRTRPDHVLRFARLCS